MLTIVTINYNNAEGLGKTLRSIESQGNSTQFQHIIIDGASVDGSRAIADSYVNANERAYLVSEKDSGIYNAMNKGLSLTTTEYVAFLNAGDVLAEKNCLSKLVGVLSSFRNVDVLYGDLNFVNGAGTVKRVWKSGDFLRSKLFLGWMPPHPMTVVRTELIRAAGGFDEGFSIAADYDLMLRILLKFDVTVKYLPIITVSMETGGVSNGSIKGILKSNYEVMKSWVGVKAVITPYWVLLMKPLRKILQLNLRSKE